MAKVARKKAGRPPAPIEEYLTRIQPYLSLGYSLRKSCELAKVPYTTVLDHCNYDPDIRTRIDILLEDTNLHARTKLVNKIKEEEYDHKVISYWLNNMDEDFKNNSGSTNVQVNIANVVNKDRDKYEIKD